MTLRPGLFVSGASAGVAQPQDARLALAGMLSGTGVLAGGAVTGSTSGPNMKYSIAAGQFVTARGAAASDGLYGFANDGALLLDSGAPAPSSGTRWDLIWVRAKNAVDGFADADSLPVAGVTVGTSGSTPTKPYASVPAGALVLAESSVGTSIANASLAVISQVASAAAARGGILPVTGSSQYPTSPRVGDYVDDATLGLLRWNGTVWAPVGKVRAQLVQLTSTTSIGGAYKVLSALSASPANGGVLNFPGLGNSAGVITIPAGFGGAYKLGGQVTLSTVASMTGMAGAIFQNGTIIHGGETISTAGGVPGLQTITLVDREFTLAAGDTLSLEAFSFGATTSSYVDSNRNYNSFLRIERVA